MKYKVIEIEMTAEELKTARTVAQNIVDLLIQITEPTDEEDEEVEERGEE